MTMLFLVLVLSMVIVLSCQAVRFEDIDVYDPSFSVDWGLTPEQRFSQLVAVASTPIKGWNSYDCFGWWVNETQMVNNIDYVADHMAPYGFNLVTVDYFWYADPGYSYNSFDAYGSVQPDPVRFPSSVGGQGFKKLAAYAHSKGLLFGLHTMRGMSIGAADKKLPVYGYPQYTGADVIDRNNGCPWDGGSSFIAFYSVNMSHPAGQAFYDHLYADYAAWGVDFIKNDCVYGQYVPDQIKAASDAIDHSGRPMLLSLSPGPGTNDHALTVIPWVNQYRATDDFWDQWSLVIRNFNTAPGLVSLIAHPGGRYGLPCFPDLDMLPFGQLQNGRLSALTGDEEQTIMSLWLIFRSPLIYGGNLMYSDQSALTLLLNPETLRVSNESINTNYLVANNSLAIWRSDSLYYQQDGMSYFTLHNLADTAQTLSVQIKQVRGTQLGTACVVRDLWQRKDVTNGPVAVFSQPFNAHASGLYAAYKCQQTALPQTVST